MLRDLTRQTSTGPTTASRLREPPQKPIRSPPVRPGRPADVEPAEIPKALRRRFWEAGGAEWTADGPMPVPGPYGISQAADRSRELRWGAACVGYVQHGYSFMPANVALRCQSNKADRSSWAHDDGVIGTDL